MIFVFIHLKLGLNEKMTSFIENMNDFNSTADFINSVHGFREIVNHYIKFYKEKPINESTTVEKEFENLIVINKQLRALSCIISLLLTNKYSELDIIHMKKTNDDIFQQLRDTQMLYMNRIMMRTKTT